MKTNNFFEELKNYFENTPKEKVFENWAKSKELDEVGPTIEEFLTHTSKYIQTNINDPIESNIHFKGNDINPEFSSGFFIY